MNLPYFFSLLQQPEPMMGALVDMLVANGAKTVAIVYMDDLFGLENFAALNNALKKTAASRWSSDKSYPLGVKDLSPVLRSHQGPEPRRLHRHHLPARHHPGQQAGQGSRLQPEVLLRLGRHRVPAVQERDDAGRRRGRAGHGLVEQQDQPGRQGLLRRAHEEVRRQGARPLGQRPLLGRAGDPAPARSSKVGLDRKAIRDYVAKSTHKTIIGDVKFTGSENTATPGTVEPVAERRVRGGVAASCNRR